MQDKILKIEKVFMSYGFKSVTMNDIARELGISKKTLYQFVENKNDLIKKVVQAHIEIEREKVIGIVEKSKDAIGQMLSISQHVNQTLKKINPAAIFDLQKYYREAWDLIETYRSDFVFSIIKNNVVRGMEEGIYRENMNAEIVGRIYLGVMNLITDQDFFPSHEFQSTDVHDECINYHIRAIASPKGMDLLENYCQKEKNA